MSQSHLVDYLGHMLEAAKLARTYAEGMSKDGFLDDKRTSSNCLVSWMVCQKAGARAGNHEP